ncbi:uncharacterized protein SAPINGB_P001021 [Magnusiomyces paraingens]|uniref:Uncharacterized protein n=1 Tax=Magnusiomyces paraingens TaxID=2606893 RepID=A0A5E8B9S4_9ASCO|nr:uncharacterized protein SAPINGB_P001021 [Saprochaete ingens]VVT46050.1 unnamed protein product [Saprochaete ingens]
MVWYNLYVISFTAPGAADPKSSHHAILIVPTARYTSDDATVPGPSVYFLEYHGLIYDKVTGSRTFPPQTSSILAEYYIPKDLPNITENSDYDDDKNDDTCNSEFSSAVSSRCSTPAPPVSPPLISSPVAKDGAAKPGESDTVDSTCATNPADVADTAAPGRPLIRAPQPISYQDWLLRATGHTSTQTSIQSNSEPTKSISPNLTVSPASPASPASQASVVSPPRTPSPAHTPLQIRMETPGTPEYLYLHGPEYPISGYRLLGRTQDPEGMVHQAETITKMLQANINKNDIEHDREVGPEAGLSWINSVIDSCILQRIFWPLDETEDRYLDLKALEHHKLPETSRGPRIMGLGQTEPETDGKKDVHVAAVSSVKASSPSRPAPISIPPASKRIFVRKEDLSPVLQDSDYKRRMARREARRVRRLEKSKAATVSASKKHSHRRWCDRSHGSDSKGDDGIADGGKTRHHRHHFSRSHHHSRQAPTPTAALVTTTAPGTAVTGGGSNSHFELKHHLLWFDQHNNDSDSRARTPRSESEPPNRVLQPNSSPSQSPSQSPHRMRRMRMLWGRSKSPSE